MNHILIAVTGASPQVLTETVYALHKQGGQMPEEVFVITTANSKQTLEKGLFEDGHWLQLFDNYKLPLLVCAFVLDRNIHSIGTIPIILGCINVITLRYLPQAKSL